MTGAKSKSPSATSLPARACAAVPEPRPALRTRFSGMPKSLHGLIKRASNCFRTRKSSQDVLRTKCRFCAWNQAARLEDDFPGRLRRGEAGAERRVVMGDDAGRREALGVERRARIRHERHAVTALAGCAYRGVDAEFRLPQAYRHRPRHGRRDQSQHAPAQMRRLRHPPTLRRMKEGGGTELSWASYMEQLTGYFSNATVDLAREREALC